MFIIQQFEITVPIQLPKELVLINLTEYEDLKKTNEVGVWWSMDDVLNRICISRKTFTEKILYNPTFKAELETFIHYPKTKGEKYYFLASKTRGFLESNFPEIMKSI